jgi:hypothetical protein
MFLEHNAKGVKQINIEVGLPHPGDHSYGDLRQTRVTVI